jgi:hypothetical protein
VAIAASKSSCVTGLVMKASTPACRA